MRRRTFLRSAACVGLPIATAGCLEAELEAAEQEPPPVSDLFSHEEIDLPVRQQLEVAADAIERAHEAGVDDHESFEAILAEEDVEVESIAPVTKDGEPVLEVEYVATEDVGRGFVERMGLVAGGFASLVNAGEEAERLEASELDPGGDKYGSFDVERPWAEEYLAGELSDREYAGEVLSTAESATE